MTAGKAGEALARCQQSCHEVMTAGKGVCGGVLERGECGVALEHFSECRDARQIDQIHSAIQKANARAHYHLAALINDLGTHLLGLALYLGGFHIVRLTGQYVVRDAGQGRRNVSSVNGC